VSNNIVQQRAKVYFRKSAQSEAKVNLGTISQCEQAFFSKRGKYSQSFSEIGYSLPGKMQYTYYLTPKEKLPKSSLLKLPKDIKPFTGKDSFMAVAVGKIGDEMKLDVWTMSEDGKLDNLVNGAAQ